jgi:transposase
MTDLPDVSQLSQSEKDALMVALWEELQKMRNKQAKKTSKNSSLPPSQGFKPSLKERSNSKESRLPAFGVSS